MANQKRPKRKAFVSTSEEKRRAAAKAPSGPVEPRSAPAKGKARPRLTDAEKEALKASGYDPDKVVPPAPVDPARDGEQLLVLADPLEAPAALVSRATQG